MESNIEEIIAALPKRRRERINRSARRMAGEMVAYADSEVANRGSNPRGIGSKKRKPL